jgi:hypothetical protein
MPEAAPAKLLRVHISEADRFEGKPLHEAVVARCRELGIAGATVFRGLEGFGETAELHRSRLLHRDQPIVVVIVDRAEKIATLVPVIEGMLDTGMMAVSDVAAVRIQRAGGPPGAGHHSQRFP